MNDGFRFCLTLQVHQLTVVPGTTTLGEQKNFPVSPLMETIEEARIFHVENKLDRSLYRFVLVVRTREDIDFESDDFIDEFKNCLVELKNKLTKKVLLSCYELLASSQIKIELIRLATGESIARGDMLEKQKVKQQVAVTAALSDLQIKFPDVDLAKVSLSHFGDQYVGARDAAEIVGLSNQRITDLARAGRIGEKIAGRFIFSITEMEKFKELDRPTGIHITPE